ncbi:sugar phosphate isomerase/epimerase family protein [Dictyoglomus thermophilum]|uniref:AP endonuclease, family 2 n=2 Tax=Dictyoglomus thermophilum TaxID=14 RepID=B5YA77_DICT6|nr:TIM barrel protein [Dictyoglomus thermophilum]ACI18543.1 AP endonuclease, family 2 [Dictyoglomus thermophilum H-6-12]TYT24462.1 sugar phosphate isomerase/epimerase [Dictyoglomus thermophilum]
MLISCSTAAFLKPEMTTEEKLKNSIEALNIILENHYDGIELFLPKDFDEEKKEILFEEAKKLKGKILTLHAPKNTLHKPIKSIFPDLVKLIKKCSDLEIKVIVLHPPFQKTMNSLLRTIFYIFDNVIHFSARHNVLLTIENVPYLLDPPEFYSALAQRYKNHVGITIDIEYLHSTQYSLNKYSEELLKNHLRNIHIRDYDGQSFDDEGKRRYLKLGEGLINFRELFEKIFKLGYNGPLTVETVFDNKIEDLKHSREFIINNFPQKSLASG